MNCELPDACGNDEREEKLIANQQKHDGRSRVQRIWQRDRNLIIAILILAVLMNTQTGRYVLYPFNLFATWVHEMSHGTAAILMGGYIDHLQIFRDGSGLCYYALADIPWKRAVVASAGYTGTAFWGGILLLFRRTTLGPTIGTIALGVAILLSCAFYIRNQFGLIAFIIEGIVMSLAGWFLPAVWLDYLFAFLACACSLNAVMDCKHLFGASQGYVNGQLQSTDAHAVSEIWGFDYRFWAISWFCFAIFMTIIGVFFARDARELSHGGATSHRPQQQVAQQQPPQRHYQPQTRQQQVPVKQQEMVAYWANPV